MCWRKETLTEQNGRGLGRFSEIVLSAPVLLGALVLLAGAVTVVRTVPASRPPLVELEDSLGASATETENVELALFSSGQDERPVEHPVFALLALPKDAARRFELIIAELRAETLQTLWPQALPAPTAFAVEIANGAQTVAVLDFAVGEDVALDVETERLLLQSIEATLLRNGADQVQILVNHEESESFLGHVALRSVLGN